MHIETLYEKGTASPTVPRAPFSSATYSHGGPAWDEKLREAVTRLDSAFKIAYEVAYEKKAVAAATTQVADLSGEPPGTRTQGPRLKRAMLYRLS